MGVSCLFLANWVFCQFTMRLPEVMLSPERAVRRGPQNCCQSAGLLSTLWGGENSPTSGTPRLRLDPLSCIRQSPCFTGTDSPRDQVHGQESRKADAEQRQEYSQSSSG